jgi:NADH-quinone oxidoreductase subunit G
MPPRKQTQLQLLEASPAGAVLIAQLAPAVRVAIAEGFGRQPGDVSARQVVTALKMLGFAYVFDTLCAADVTIVEEAAELLHRLKTEPRPKRPMFTSCCPGWVALVEKEFPELLPDVSTTRSPQAIMGTIIKQCFAPRVGLAPEKVWHVSVMPCVRKQAEAARDPSPLGVDCVLTTNDLISMLTERAIDLPTLPETDFDEPLGTGSGASALFGSSGGVMVAALRHVYELLTGGMPLPDSAVLFVPVPSSTGLPPDVLEADVDLLLPDGTTRLQLKVAVVIGLGSAKKVARAVLHGEAPQYDFVEVMACAPAGCVGGAGNPPVGKNKQLIEARRQALRALDERSTMRSAYGNAAVTALFEAFLDSSRPNEGIAHDLFHASDTAHVEAQGAPIDGIMPPNSACNP